MNSNNGFAGVKTAIVSTLYSTFILSSVHMNDGGATAPQKIVIPIN